MLQFSCKFRFRQKIPPIHCTKDPSPRILLLPVAKDEEVLYAECGVVELESLRLLHCALVEQLLECALISKLNILTVEKAFENNSIAYEN